MNRAEAIEFAKEQQEIFGGRMGEFLKFVETELSERRGKWIIDRAFGNDVMSDERMVLCSACGKGFMFGKTKFCPNCGARMEEDDNE